MPSCCPKENFDFKFKPATSILWISRDGIASNDFYYKVELNRRKVLICSCKESCYEGLPCRHELCIFVKETMPASSLNIHSRWNKEYFNQNDLSDIEDLEDSENEYESDENNESQSSQSFYGHRSDDENEEVKEDVSEEEEDASVFGDEIKEEDEEDREETIEIEVLINKVLIKLIDDKKSALCQRKRKA